jgi:hypothetical protein
MSASPMSLSKNIFCHSATPNENSGIATAVSADTSGTLFSRLSISRSIFKWSLDAKLPTRDISCRIIFPATYVSSSLSAKPGPGMPGQRPLTSFSSDKIDRLENRWRIPRSHIPLFETKSVWMPECRLREVRVAAQEN